MNQQELQKEIVKYYQKLPKETQEIFSSMKWLETLKQISLRYSLNDKQIETIGTETTLVLLGIIHSDEYENILKNELGLQKDSIEKMFTEIDESILKTIRPQLEETFYKNDEEEKDKIDKRFNDLSKETKDAIEKSDYQTKIYEIGQKYNLTVYQMGILGESTINVMLGITLPNKFGESLERLELPTEKTTEIINNINEGILKKIREQLVKNINQNKFSKDDESKTMLERPIESREEMLKHIEKPESINNYELPARSAFSTPASNASHSDEGWADAGGRITNLEKEKTHPILAQKLGGSFKIEPVETDHSLENITKNSSANSEIVKSSNVDPYRELPE